jgi:hypothetical protein
MISLFLTSSVEIQQPIVKVNLDGGGEVKEKEREMKKGWLYLFLQSPCPTSA